ncbi:MAG TPA: cytochrome c oxidase subunit II, partial [Tepidisphaeraceae bacterium]|nr:cytochrome c oxidase subunit II [Tepidisphaeraceae bacterium]
MLNAILAQSKGATFWMPEQASTVAAEVDWMFYAILYICYFFFFLILVMMLGFVLKYRHRSGAVDHPAPAGHSLALEMLWTIPPTIIVLFIAWRGIRGFMDMAVIPPNAYEIQVTGQMWNWSFTYPNGTTVSELHIPKDVPVRLVMNSTDVIHSLFVPEFRSKKDVVPGRFSKMWFQATEARGEYDAAQKKWVNGFPIYCTEYCGTSHSEMLSQVIVHPTREMFDDWLADASVWTDKMTPQARGAQLYGMYCTSCHSVDGSSNTGPTWKDLFGADRAFTDGSQSKADEDYIRESIYYPQKKIVAGYPAGQMNSFLGQINETDVGAIIWYMKSLSDKFDQ